MLLVDSASAAAFSPPPHCPYFPNPPILKSKWKGLFRLCNFPAGCSAHSPTQQILVMFAHLLYLEGHHFLLLLLWGKQRRAEGFPPAPRRVSQQSERGGARCRPHLPHSEATAALGLWLCHSHVSSCITVPGRTSSTSHVIGGESGPVSSAPTCQSQEACHPHQVIEDSPAPGPQSQLLVPWGHSPHSGG